MVLPNVALMAVFASFSEFRAAGIADVLMQAVLYLAMSTLVLITSTLASRQVEGTARPHPLGV